MFGRVTKGEIKGWRWEQLKEQQGFSIFSACAFIGQVGSQLDKTRNVFGNSYTSYLAKKDSLKWKIREHRQKTCLSRLAAQWILAVKGVHEGGVLVNLLKKENS